MNEATHTAGSEHSPEWANCPAWCVDHERADVGDPDEFLVHIAAVRRAASNVIEMRQIQFADSRSREPVFLYLDGDEMPIADAAVLAGTLLAAAIEGGAR